MASDAERVQFLEEELGKKEAQIRAAAVSHEQACQVLEAQYGSLNGAHERLQVEVQKLQADKASTDEALSKARDSIQSLRSELARKDDKVTSLECQVRALGADKAQLHHQLQQRARDAATHAEEAREMLQRLEKLTQDCIRLRSEVATRSDSEAQARQELVLSQADVARLQGALEQRSERTEALRREKDQANAQLKDELASLRMAERDAAISLQHLRASHTELEARHQEAVASMNRAKEQLLDETQKWSAVVEGHVREKQALSQIQGFLTTEKDMLDQRVQELEAMVPVMQEELRAVKEECDTRVAEMRAKCEAAEQEAQRSQAHLETVMTSARLAPSEVDRGGAAAAAAPSSSRQLALEAPEGSNMSYTKLYIQWQELQEENRNLQRIARRNEHDMDQVTMLLERKQVEVQAQHEEFVSLKRSYARTEAQLAAHADEKRALEGRLAQALAQARRLEERLAVAERTSRDISRQVAALVEENSRLKGQPSQRADGPRFPDNVVEGGEIDAQVVITTQLVEFRDVDSCLQQNRTLLTALRSLAADVEAGRTAAAQQVEQRLGAEVARLQKQVDQLTEQLRASKETTADLENRARSYVMLMRQHRSENSNAAANALVPAGEPHISERALRDVKAAFDSECTTMRAEHESLRAMLQQELKETQERLFAALNDANLHKLQFQAEGERRAMLAADFDELNRQLAEERRHHVSWQEMAMEAQKKLTAELHAAETDRSRVIDLEYKLSEATIRREQLEAEAERTREHYSMETGLRHAAEGRQQAAEEALRDSTARHQAHAAQLAASLQASSDEVIQAKREAAEAKAALEQAEAVLRDPERSEKINRLEVALDQAKRRVSELEVQLASAESKFKASERVRKDAEDRNMELDKEIRAVQKRLEAAAGERPDGDARPSGDAPGPSAAGEAPESREAQLALQLQIARNELEFWQTDAATNAAHVRTYKELSKAADEELDAARAALAAEKEAAKRSATRAEERVAELQAEVNRHKEQEASLRVELNQAASEKHGLETQLESVQAESAQALKAAQDSAHILERRLLASQEAHGRAVDETKALRAEIDTLTIQLGDRVKQIQETTAKLEESNRSLAAKESELASVQRAAGEDAARASRDIAKALDDVRAAQVANIELKEQKEELQRQLEQRIMDPASTSSDAGGSEMGTYKRLLSMRSTEIQKLQSELQVAKIRAERSERQAEEYRASAAETRARLETFQRQHAGLLMSEGEHRARMAGIEEMNIVRAANVGLQAENQKLVAECKQLKEAARAASQQQLTAERRAAELDATISALQQNLATQTSAAERWRRQASEYINKYGTVDKDTHQEALQQLDAARKELAAALAERTTLRARVKDLRDEVANAAIARESLSEDLKGAQAAAAHAQGRVQEAVEQARAEMRASNQTVAKNLKTYKAALAKLGRPESDKQPTVWATKYAAQFEALSKEVAELRAARDSQSSAQTQAAKSLEDLRSAAGPKNKLHKDLAEAQAKLAAATEEVARLASELEASKAAGKKLSDELAAARASVASLSAELRAKTTSVNSMKMLLDKAKGKKESDAMEIAALTAQVARLTELLPEEVHAQAALADAAAREQPPSAAAPPPAPEAAPQAPTLKRAPQEGAVAPAKRPRVAPRLEPTPIAAPAAAPAPAGGETAAAEPAPSQPDASELPPHLQALAQLPAQSPVAVVQEVEASAAAVVAVVEDRAGADALDEELKEAEVAEERAEKEGDGDDARMDTEGDDGDGDEARASQVVDVTAEDDGEDGGGMDEADADADGGDDEDADAAELDAGGDVDDEPALEDAAGKDEGAAEAPADADATEPKPEGAGDDVVGGSDEEGQLDDDAEAEEAGPEEEDEGQARAPEQAEQAPEGEAGGKAAAAVAATAATAAETAAREAREARRHKPTPIEFTPPVKGGGKAAGASQAAGDAGGPSAPRTAAAPRSAPGKRGHKRA